MAKNNKKNRGRYVPILSRLGTENERERWKDSAPRLTEEQKATVQGITRRAYSKLYNKPMTRATFMETHENLENELAEGIQEQLGLIAGVEWRGRLASHVLGAMQRDGVKTNGVIEGIMPTQDFIESPLFDKIEIFDPVLVLFQHEDYEKFIRSTEESIKQAERRRERGEEYFTSRDRAINYRPKNDTDDMEDNVE